MSLIERKYTNARMSKIVRHGGLVYLCGQTATGSAAAEQGIGAQTHETLSRVDALLKEAGSDRSYMLSAIVHLKNIEDFAGMNAVWEAWMPVDAAPARTTVEARLASPNLLVEFTVVAAVVQ